MIAGLLSIAFVFRNELWTIFSNPDNVEEWVRSWGPAGPLVYVLAQTTQVIVFVLPGDIVQLAGGYLFGVVGGLSLSLVGIAIGSSVNFLVGRSLGIRFVHGLFGKRQVERFDGLINSPQARLGFFLLFLIPGIPKDVLCYLGGISSLRFPVFMLVSMTARIPGILGSSIIGDAAAAGRYIMAAVIFGVAVTLFVVGLIFRKRATDVVRRLMEKRSRRREAEAHPPREE